MHKGILSLTGIVSAGKRQGFIRGKLVPAIKTVLYKYACLYLTKGL